MEKTKTLTDKVHNACEKIRIEHALEITKDIAENSEYCAPEDLFDMHTDYSDSYSIGLRLFELFGDGKDPINEIFKSINRRESTDEDKKDYMQEIFIGNTLDNFIHEKGSLDIEDEINKSFIREKLDDQKIDQFGYIDKFEQYEKIKKQVIKENIENKNIAKIISKCLELDPKKRYKNTKQIHRKLKWLNFKRKIWDNKKYGLLGTLGLALTLFNTDMITFGLRRFQGWNLERQYNNFQYKDINQRAFSEIPDEELNLKQKEIRSAINELSTITLPFDSLPIVPLVDDVFKDKDVKIEWAINGYKICVEDEDVEQNKYLRDVTEIKIQYAKCAPNINNNHKYTWNCYALDYDPKRIYEKITQFETNESVNTIQDLIKEDLLMKITYDDIVYFKKWSLKPNAIGTNYRPIIMFPIIKHNQELKAMPGDYFYFESIMIDRDKILIDRKLKNKVKKENIENKISPLVNPDLLDYICAAPLTEKQEYDLMYVINKAKITLNPDQTTINWKWDLDKEEGFNINNDSPLLKTLNEINCFVRFPEHVKKMFLYLYVDKIEPYFKWHNIGSGEQLRWVIKKEEYEQEDSEIDFSPEEIKIYQMNYHDLIFQARVYQKRANLDTPIEFIMLLEKRNKGHKEFFLDHFNNEQKIADTSYYRPIWYYHNLLPFYGELKDFTAYKIIPKLDNNVQDYKITLIVDPENHWKETNELNNILEFTFNVDDENNVINRQFKKIDKNVSALEINERINYKE